MPFEIDPELTEQRIQVARELFAGWSSGDLDAPLKHMAPDAVLFDIIGGEHRGQDAIRSYFAHGLERYPDLVLAPTGDFWARPDGLAMLWVMTGTQSYLVFDGLTVVREADYHDKGSRERSLRAQLG
jgi:hypothetical protein